MVKIRWKAANKPGTAPYYAEPYTVQHFTDWAKDVAKIYLVELPQFLWTIRSKKSRQKMAHQYNDAVFGWVPQEQTFVIDDHGTHQMTDDERKSWFGR